MNTLIYHMKLELLDFSEKIEQEFDFGDDKSTTWFSFLLRLFGLWLFHERDNARKFSFA